MEGVAWLCVLIFPLAVAGLRVLALARGGRGARVRLSVGRDVAEKLRSFAEDMGVESISSALQALIRWYEWAVDVVSRAGSVEDVERAVDLYARLREVCAPLLSGLPPPSAFKPIPEGAVPLLRRLRDVAR